MPVARMELRSIPSYRVPGYGLTTGEQDRADAVAGTMETKLSATRTAAMIRQDAMVLGDAETISGSVRGYRFRCKAEAF